VNKIFNDNAYYFKQSKYLKEVAEKHKLIYSLDEFGMSTKIYKDNKEIGFIFEWDKGKSLELIGNKNYKKLHKSWKSLCNELEKSL